MKILAIDTSATAASVCVAEEGIIIGESFVNTALTHSQTLMPMIEQMLQNCGVAVDELDAVAVNAGPGSFTGVRIGVAAAKGIAFPKNLPCVSVSTLESMAYNITGGDCIVCACMDARCSQVYNALFKIKDGRVERLCEDRALSLGDLRIELEKLTEPVVLVGDGARLCAEKAAESLSNVRLTPANIQIQNAASVACAAFESISKGNILSAEKLMPVYLRLPQAQRELNKRLETKQ